MKRTVHLTDDAWGDLFGIYNYIALNTSDRKADRVFAGLYEHCASLKTLSSRGHLPPELEDHQRTDLRELRFKTYRILYRVRELSVDVLAVFDGRRDARSLIGQRMVRN